jgi:hypothetical protein
MTPTDRATAYIEAAVADGKLLHGPDVAAEFGIAAYTADRLICNAEMAAAPLYVPAPRVSGPEMAPGRKAALVGQAQAARVPRKAKR